jgi:hypothetical protein
MSKRKESAEAIGPEAVFTSAVLAWAQSGRTLFPKDVDDLWKTALRVTREATHD